jgi:DNA uptake protein ComE-like DNA-binding protein
MKNPLKQIVNQYLKFLRSDRNAILILSAFILLVIVANTIISSLEPKPSFDSSEYANLRKEWDGQLSEKRENIQSLFVFNPNTIPENKLDSLLIPAFIKKNILNYRKAGGRFYAATDFQKIYGVTDSIYKALEAYIEIEKKIRPKKTIRSKDEKVTHNITGFFNPNEADFVELKRFGFSDFQANNLLNYRKKGGVIKEAIDLRKIYGLDSLFYSAILVHVQIEKEINAQLVKPKFESLNIELNSADSSELVKIKGIGPVYSSRIIKYRNLLGGFYSKNQLLEVYHFPEETYYEIKNYICVDTSSIKQIRINFIEYADLLRHPYLNNKQVETILDFRNKNGVFEDRSQIQSNGLIDSVTFNKIRPYFTCR